MDKDYFMNAGVPPPQQFETTMPMQWSGLNDHSFLDTNDQYSHFESSWNPMVSSAPSATSNDAFVLRELIGKLGSATTAAAGLFPMTNNNNNNNNNNSSIHNLGNSVPLTPPLPSLSADPGFAERAAKFSCFGSRSFNGRTSQVGPSNGELCPPLHRVSSSPSLKQGGSPNRPLNGVVLVTDKKVSNFLGSGSNSNDESSVSEQIPSGETGSIPSIELNSRKRKATNRGKNKDDRSNAAKEGNGEDNANAKRSKNAESSKIETKAEEETKEGSNDESDKQKTNQKPPEAPKDYIHVRARRGQATDSHSLAERVRREKISERMKLLQDLVPGCNKVTGKALMLDEIINYVQSLQRQVEFLSMKLSSVNPSLDINMEILSKDIFQQNTSVPQQIFPLDSSGPAFYHQQPQLGQNPVDPLHFDGPSCRNLGIHLPSVDGFNENLPQFQAFTEDDLHSIVQMGFVQNPVSFPVQNQSSDMKVEL